MSNTFPLDVVLPPTQAELPYDDGIPMESPRHKAQMDLLIDALLLWFAQRSDGFVGGNMFVYFSLEQVRNQDFRGPDFFAVLGVPKGERKSWVVWEEGKAPDVVIELLSESTAQVDKNEKKLIYQDQMRVSEYFWFDPLNADDWAGFLLQHGVYQPLAVSDRQQLVSRSLGLGLQRCQGIYKDIEATWLRWATLEGELLPTYEEQERLYAEVERRRAEVERRQAEIERQRAEQEYQRAEQANQRAEQAQMQLQNVVRNLLQEGMSLGQVSRLTGLTEAQIQQME